MIKDRRRTLKKLGLGAALLASASATRALQAQPSGQKNLNAKVVVIGGGFGGSTAARRLKALAPTMQVTLIDKDSGYTACPFSNLVISGHRKISQQQFDWRALSAAGINVVNQKATEIDVAGRRVRLADGTSLAYTKLVVSPGVSLRFDALEGYSEAASAIMPHAWQAGAQTLLLKKQLEAMPDNGLVAISVPANPYRCPPGPYERASLIANYLAKNKPNSKLIILDAKDNFSKKALFQEGWQSLYGTRIEWRGLSDSGGVNRVDAQSRTLYTDFDEIKADVANVIPPQAAGQIAADAGLTDATGWCPVNPQNFSSTLAADVHVIGDAIGLGANAMPKSAFSANAQAKLCAAQIVRELAGLEPVDTTLINTCYSLLAPDYGISVAGVYRPDLDEQPPALSPVEGTGGSSPTEGSDRSHKLEARYAASWFNTITKETFG